MIPWADDEKVLVLRVELLEPFINLNRSVEVLLIPPAGDVERRHRNLGECRDERLHLPKGVVIRMRDVIVPRGNLAVEVLGVDIREWA